jgi:hypothetical protein
MIAQEEYGTRADGVVLIRTFSTAGFKIQNEANVVYSDAIDVQGTTHTYTETAEYIDDDTDDTVRSYRVVLPAGTEVYICAVDEAFPVVSVYSDDVPMGNIRWAVDEGKLIAWSEGLTEQCTVVMSVIG